MRPVKQLVQVGCLTALLASCAGTRSDRSATSRLDSRMRSSTAVLEAAVSIPEKTIPESILRNAYGVAVIPAVVKGAFVLGGRYGKGVMVVKKDDGTWSDPSFVQIGGGSIGWQWGVQSIDLVLVFRTEGSVRYVETGAFTLGANAGVAAGPVGRNAEASTNAQLNAEVYSYARSRGLFLGVSLDGAQLSIDKDANAIYYESDTVTAREIFEGKVPSPSPVAGEFVKEVETVTGTPGSASR